MTRIEGLTQDLQLIPSYRIEWCDPSCRWSVATANPGPLDAHSLGSSTTLAFEIIAPAPRLGRLLVQLATHRRDNTPHIWAELASLDGAILKRQLISSETVVDNAFCEVLDLSGVTFQVGAKYRVSLSSPTAADRDFFAVWAASVPRGRGKLDRRLDGFRNARTFVYGPDLDPGGTEAGALRCVLIVDRAADLTSEMRSRLSTAWPGERIDVVAFETLDQIWTELSDADVVLFTGDLGSQGVSRATFDALCFELYRRGACAIVVDGTDHPPTQPGEILFQLQGRLAQHACAWREAVARCQFTLRLSDGAVLRPGDTGARGGGLETPQPLPEMVEAAAASRLPRVAVVSALYNKAEIVERFIDSVVGQTYPGEIHLVFVDDRSPQDDAVRARMAALRLECRGARNRTVTVLENERNLGNCGSRLAGIAAVLADIYVVIDCDCLVNRDFVAAHVFEHAHRDVDVVIGPLNIEAQDEDPVSVLSELERHPERVLLQSDPQDPIQANGFLNCITHNFSIKRAAALAEPLFDTAFSYSAQPGSGFGWEDVEMGYRLYARGAVIAYTPHAFSVHATHGSSAPDKARAEGSLRNFERLLAKHPDFPLVARRWTLDTYGRIVAWLRQEGTDAGEPQRRLEKRFEPLLSEPGSPSTRASSGRRGLRILSYRWHVPHQYELHKLPHHFTLATHFGEPGMADGWTYNQRPLRPNVRMTPSDQIDPRDFDLAIPCSIPGCRTACFRRRGAIRSCGCSRCRTSRKSGSATARRPSSDNTRPSRGGSRPSGSTRGSVGAWWTGLRPSGCTSCAIPGSRLPNGGSRMPGSSGTVSIPRNSRPAATISAS